MSSRTVSAGPDALAKTDTSWRRGLWIAAALVVYAAARLAVPLPGLTATGQAILGTAFAGAILWVTEAVPIGVTALVVLVFLGASPGMRMADAAGGFASDVTFFLIGAVAIGTAVESSGLANRAARFLARAARGSPARLYAQMIVSLPFFALLLPSAITRNAILIPAYRDALGAMGIGPSARIGRALMLALGVLNPLASSALLTGGITSMTAATLLGGFSWLRWFALMAVPYYALLFGGALILRMMVGRFEAPGADSATTATVARQPISPAEYKTLAVLALTSLLWLTDSVHGLSPAVPALAAAAVLLLPRTGVLSWKMVEARLSWGLILTVGASLSLASAITASGAAAWLGAQIVGRLTSLSDFPVVLVIGLVAATAAIHLAITNLAACIALLLPLVATIAHSAGLNPIVCGLVVTLVVDAVILYPVQTAANLMAYESGYFAAADVRRLGMLMLGLATAVVLLAIPYWAWLGLPLVQR